MIQDFFKYQGIKVLWRLRFLGYFRTLHYSQRWLFIIPPYGPPRKHCVEFSLSHQVIYLWPLKWINNYIVGSPKKVPSFRFYHLIVTTNPGSTPITWQNYIHIFFGRCFEGPRRLTVFFLIWLCRIDVFSRWFWNPEIFAFYFFYAFMTHLWLNNYWEWRLAW